ncbi:TMEM175 family protein [Ferriphaselus sp. R-1]|uniref:TMEM175 family protein n=1 Tax=Ferriphaselus sp. R-1 TaxID=1485544 RepID=UPI00068D28D8|nr:TMEM175 family protein [Ferriphaselus sp. R-1]
MEKETARLEAFSDGIFGVAITLLALDIKIPESVEAADDVLWRSIVQLWPAYLTFFNSFAVVLLIWMGHHMIFREVRKADTRLIFLNGLMLLLIALFPYPTRTIGQFAGTGAEAVATAFYAAYTGLVSLSFLLLTLRLRATPALLVSGAGARAALGQLARFEAIGVALYAMLALAALWWPGLALAGTCAMWLYWGLVVALGGRQGAITSGEAA